MIEQRMFERDKWVVFGDHRSTWFVGALGRSWAEEMPIEQRQKAVSLFTDRDGITARTIVGQHSRGCSAGNRHQLYEIQCQRDLGIGKHGSLSKAPSIETLRLIAKWKAEMHPSCLDQCRSMLPERGINSTWDVCVKNVLMSTEIIAADDGLWTERTFSDQDVLLNKVDVDRRSWSVSRSLRCFPVYPRVVRIQLAGLTLLQIDVDVLIKEDLEQKHLFTRLTRFFGQSQR